MNQDPQESRGVILLALNVIFAVFALALTLLRFLTRLVIVRKFGPEDFSIGVAAIFTILFTIFISQQVKNGLGEHLAALSPSEVEDELKGAWSSIIVYYLALNFTKISVLFQYLQLIVYERTRKVIWVIMALVTIYGIATFFDSIFLCLPPSDFWTERGHSATCTNFAIVSYVNAAVNIILEIAIVVLPMPTLYSLAIPIKQKIAVMGLFALGGFVCLTSITRLYSLHLQTKSKDKTWDAVAVTMWSVVEVNTAIICACLPTLRPLFSRGTLSWLRPDETTTDRNTSVFVTSFNGVIIDHGTTYDPADEESVCTHIKDRPDTPPVAQVCNGRWATADLYPPTPTTPTMQSFSRSSENLSSPVVPPPTPTKPREFGL